LYLRPQREEDCGCQICNLNFFETVLGENSSQFDANPVRSMQRVVIDHGTGSIKAGEGLPNAVFPSILGTQKVPWPVLSLQQRDEVLLCARHSN
jgi:hypothetical protein